MSERGVVLGQNLRPVCRMRKNVGRAHYARFERDASSKGACLPKIELVSVKP